MIAWETLNETEEGKARVDTTKARKAKYQAGKDDGEEDRRDEKKEEETNKEPVSAQGGEERGGEQEKDSAGTNAFLYTRKR